MRKKNKNYLIGLLFKKLDHVDQAEEYFKIASDKNHALSQYEIALIHYDWHNSDNSIAIEWFEKAAKNKHLESQFMLGKIYDEDDDLDRDTAMMWYEKAAKRGHAEAQYQLAYMYDEDDDHANARKWVLKSAKQGNDGAIDLIRDINQSNGYC